MRRRWLRPLPALLALAACSRAPADQQRIEAIVHDYILAHPEIVPQAMDRLRERMTAKAIAANRDAIETPFAGAWAGAPRPRAVLTMFTDYSCGYCRQSLDDVARLIADEPGLRVVWREIPVLGPQSEMAAKAALAAAKQGRYLPFHRAVFEAGRPDPAALADAARSAGLDAARLAGDGTGPDVSREIDGNLKLAAALGVSGTPAFVIGGRMLSGAVGYQALKAAVDAQLAGRGPA